MGVVSPGLMNVVAVLSVLLLAFLWAVRNRSTRMAASIRANVAPDTGFTLETQGGWLGGLWIVVTGITSRIEITGAPSDERVEIGDPALPDVTGDVLVALSAMNAGAREHFHALRKYDVHLQKGRLVCSTSALDGRLHGHTVASTMLDLAREMSRHGPSPAALRENALRDPLLAVRSRNAELLVTTYPDSPEASEVLAAIREDAVVLPLHWRTIARLLAPDAAVSESDAPEIVASVRARMAAGLVDMLLRRLASFGKTGERLLVAILEPVPDDDVSRRALAYLGGTASVDVIESLRRVTTFLSRSAFERAIELIKARAEGADPGQLTLSESSEQRGQLSVAIHAGALSAADRDRRR